MILERIVRPFQLITVTPSRRIIAGEKIVPNVLVNIGKPGSGLCFTYNLFFFENVIVEESKDRTEVKRTEVTKRITNPDDAEQHVDVKRMTSVVTRNDTDPTDHQKITFVEKNSG
jgi:hypothetical protein